MTGWNDGYVIDVPYLARYFHESAPVWIATAATLLGIRAPDPLMPFVYGDLGCGNGVTALVTAATMPHADVWAFDFNPEHIQSGRDIARRAGLTNIHFEEASFEDLRGRSPSSIPTFDYVSAHGVLTWVSPDNRKSLFEVISQRLTPGGIAYISYNVATGWAGMRPVQELMRLLAEVSHESSDVATLRGLDLLRRMSEADAALFQAHPGLDARLTQFRENDQRYVAHELLNGHWHPFMFAPVASAMAAIKCEYIGSATLSNNLADFAVPAALREVFDSARDTRLRETLHDIASADGFRRDLYQRGRHRMTSAERILRVDDIRLVRTFEPVRKPLVFASSFSRLETDEARYGELLDVLDRGPLTIGQLRRHDGLAGWTGPELLKVVTVLMSAGYLAPMLTEHPSGAAIASTSRLNTVHAALFEQGYSRPYLAFPALGTAWRIDEVEILALDALNSGVATEEQALVDSVRVRLFAAKYQLRKSGQISNETDAISEAIACRVRDLLIHHLPIMHFLGALTGGQASQIL